MENLFLVKIQTNVNQRDYTKKNVLSEVSHTIIIHNFVHQNWRDFLYKNRFFFARLNRLLYFWVFKPVGSYMQVFTVKYFSSLVCMLPLCKNPISRLYKIDIGLVYNSLFCIFYLKTDNHKIFNFLTKIMG